MRTPKYKSKHNIEVAEQKKLVRKNLKQIKTLMDKVEKLFNVLPTIVQDNILEVHNLDGSLNYCIRWGQQAATELLEKKTLKKITENL